MTPLLPEIDLPILFSRRRPSRIKSAETTLAAAATLSLDLRVPQDPWGWRTNIQPVQGSLNIRPVTKDIMLYIFGDSSMLIYAYGRFIPFAFDRTDAFPVQSYIDTLIPCDTDIKCYQDLPWELCPARLTALPTKPCPYWHQVSGLTEDVFPTIKTLVNCLATIVAPAMFGTYVNILNGIIRDNGSFQPGALFYSMDRQGVGALTREARTLEPLRSLLNSHKLLMHCIGIDSQTYRVSGLVNTTTGFRISPVSKHDLCAFSETYPQLLDLVE